MEGTGAMPGQPGCTGKSKNGRWRTGIAAGALLVLGITPFATAPNAHADIEDLIFQPVLDAIAQTVSSVDPSLALSLDPGLDASSLVAPALAATDVAPLAALPENAVALTMHNTTEPLLTLSISGGASLPILLDTGSNGLVVPWYDIGLDNLTFPTGANIGAYSGGLDYFYVTLPDQTVDFGNGIVSGPTNVDVELFAWPTTLQGLFLYPNFESFLAPAGASGVLGIAPDAFGPDRGPAAVVSDLPGALSQGVLINEPGGYVQFGPNPYPENPIATLNGLASTDLKIQVGANGGLQAVNNAIIDSGGVYGTIPQSILTNGTAGQVLSPGELIKVYDETGQQLLYQYTTTGTNSPTIVSSGPLNTGYVPFSQFPIYIGYSHGGDLVTTTFDRLPAS